MPLEFICWSLFHFQISVQTLAAAERSYVTWDGVDPIGIWGPQCTLPLATPVRSEHLLELLGGELGKGVDGEDLAAVKTELGGRFLSGTDCSSSQSVPPPPQL